MKYLSAPCMYLHLHRFAPQYLNDPACPVRVPLPPQKKRTESSSKYEEEASARSEESSAESTTDAAAATATATAAAESEERVMVALAAGVLGSKPVCRLRPQECRRLAELAVRAFLGSRGLGSDDRVRVFVMVLPWKACRGRRTGLEEEHGKNMAYCFGRSVPICSQRTEG